MRFFQRHFEPIALSIATLVYIIVVGYAISITDTPKPGQGVSSAPRLSGEVGDTLSDGTVGVTLRTVDSDPVDPQFTCARLLVSNISDDDVLTKGNESLGMVKDGVMVDMILGTVSVPLSIAVNDSVQVSSCFDVSVQEAQGATVLFNIPGNDVLSWEVNNIS